MENKTEKHKMLLENLSLGKAKVMVLKTLSGTYGRHGQTGWDDQLYWKLHDAWISSVQVYGKLDWKGKYRENAKREHSGTGEIQMIEHEIYDSEREAEDHALEQAIKLEEMGFEVELDFGEIWRTHIGTDYKWINDGPPSWLVNRKNYNVGRMEEIQK